MKFFSFFLLVNLLVLFCIPVNAQKIGVFNKDQKLIYKIKQGKYLDVRLDHDKLYPEISDSVVESRLFGLIDSISGSKIYLIENQVIINYTKKSSILLEMEYEYTSLIIDINDIKEISFTPTMASIGKALMTVGLVTIIASPLLGFTPEGYSTDRLIGGLAIGGGMALIGGGLSLTFGQKPVKFKEFDGPEYFDKYQRGSISVLQ